MDASTDYLYIGRGFNYATPSEVAIAYENPADMKDGINLLFADGRVEFREMRWAADEIGVLRKQLKGAAAEYRPVIRRLIEARTFERAYAIYCYGMETDRAFARMQLLRMLRRHPTSARVLAFLAALHIPRRLTGRLRRLAGRLRKQPRP